MFAGQSAVYGEASGSMVAIRRLSSLPYQADFELVRLEEVEATAYTLPPNYIDAENAGVTAAFREYATPLLGDNFPDYFTPF